MSRPRVLIEQWLPIDQIGAECMRDASAAQKPPLNRLHVWWARRPLTVSRTAILTSLLPAYHTGDDESVRPWPQKFLKQFSTFDAYKQWFLKLIGIHGNPAASRRIIEWAKTQGIKLTPAIMGKLPVSWKEGLPSDMRISIPYGYPRAFTYNPTEEQLETLYDLLEWTWGTREITFCDPMSGGGSIPFEALRFGLTVHANELNPVASVILKATLDYPARFGPSLAEDIRKYGKMWCDKVRVRLDPFFHLGNSVENIFCYVWARTIPCPATSKPVPLAPNWWLRKGDEPVAVKIIADSNCDRCRFEIVLGKTACAKSNPDKGTIKRGTALNPWQSGETIAGDYIKTRAQAGEMGQQLVAVGIKKGGELTFRAPTPEDEQACHDAEKERNKRSSQWDALGLLPTEPRREGRADWACEIYGATRWCDTYTPRQLLAMITLVEVLDELSPILTKELGAQRSVALRTCIALAIGKAADYNSKQTAWYPGRAVLEHAFKRHDLSMRWCFAEFDASRNLAPWVLDQVSDALGEMAILVAAPPASLFGPAGKSPVLRLDCRTGPAQALTTIPNQTIRCITVDPPYYDNVLSVR